MMASDGGSVHDPGAPLPPPMWDRGLIRTPLACRACLADPTGKRYSPMWAVPPGGPAPVGGPNVPGWVAHICGVCDRVGPLPA